MAGDIKEGRPLKFQSVEALQEGIDNYFANTNPDNWTWTGLALHLDTSRETLREYQLRPEFVDPLKKALLMVENGYELDLKKYGRSGTIFALKNFDWKDKTETDITSNGETVGQADPLVAAEFAAFMKHSTEQSE